MRRGSICVAAAGNDGASVLVYPAAFPETIGVASTDLDDFVASFSNYGNDLVKLAAPGVAVITTYPGGGWAAASGHLVLDAVDLGRRSRSWPSARLAEASSSISIERSTLSRTVPTCTALRSALDVGFGRVDFARAAQNLSLDAAPTGNGNN